MLVSALEPWHHEPMGEIVNLRRVRRAKAREADAAQAAENRRRSGATKAERKATEQQQNALDRKLDASRLDRD